MNKFPQIKEQMDLILRGSEEVIPIEELGISIDEYQAIQNHIMITLPEKSGPLSLLIDKVYLLNRKGGEGKEIDVKAKTEIEAIKIFDEQGYSDDQVHREKFIDYQFCEIEEIKE